MIAEDEFVLALTTVRATYGTSSASEADLKEIVATEESRVADATVLAELIAIRLAAQPAVNAAAPAASPEESNSPFLTPIPFPTSASAAPLSVADLLDGMLSQDKREVRKPSRG
jgi:hypothetical protein